MKLKMESSGDVTILTVTDSVAPEHIAVLKAGLSKLAASGKDQILVDLSALTERDVEVTVAQPALDELSHWASEQKFELLVQSKMAHVGDIDDRQKALEIFQSKFAEVLFREVALKAELRGLKSRKAILETNLKKLKGDDQKVRGLRQDHARLRASVRTLEKQVRHALEKRPKESPAAASPLWEKLNQIVPTILEQQGVIRK